MAIIGPITEAVIDTKCPSCSEEIGHNPDCTDCIRHRAEYAEMDGFVNALDLVYDHIRQLLAEPTRTPSEAVLLNRLMVRVGEDTK